MSRPQTADPRHVLSLLVEGLTVAEVARELRCSRPHVYKLVRLARSARDRIDRDDVPDLVPIFPVGDYTPSTPCNHDKRPIPVGSRWYCPVCDRSGLDHLPYFKDARPLPRDPKPKTPAPRTPTRRESRRQRYAGREAATIRRIIAQTGNRTGSTRGGNRP